MGPIGHYLSLEMPCAWKYPSGRRQMWLIIKSPGWYPLDVIIFLMHCLHTFLSFVSWKFLSLLLIIFICIIICIHIYKGLISLSESILASNPLIYWKSPWVILSSITTLGIFSTISLFQLFDGSLLGSNRCGWNISLWCLLRLDSWFMTSLLEWVGLFISIPPIIFSINYILFKCHILTLVISWIFRSIFS